MTAQIAALWSNFLGDGSLDEPYRPRFTDNVQAGELWALNLVDLLSTVQAQNSELELPNPAIVEKHNVTIAGYEPRIGVVYVYADSARIDLAAGSPHYYVAWRYTVDRNHVLAASDPLPTQNSLSAEATALLNWLSAQTGKSTTNITAWLRGKFGVATNQQALNWITTHPRSELISKLAEAFQIWQSANQEII